MQDVLPATAEDSSDTDPGVADADDAVADDAGTDDIGDTPSKKRRGRKP